MSFYLPRKYEKSLTERYDSYCRRCQSQGIEPVPFRSWAIIDAEYDIEWAAVGREYDKLLVELDREGE